MKSQQTAGRKPARSIYARVTDQVLAELAQGTAPWRRPWDANFGLPRNLVSRRPYHGVNVLTLMTTALGTGFPANWWLTFKQAKERGGHVKRGERGCPVLFYQQVVADNSDDETDPTPPQYRPVLRTYTVFNVAQCSGLELPVAPSVAWDPIQTAERIVEAVGIPVRYMGDKAFYQPGRDLVTLPPRASFASATDFYGTLLHELVHATGHESRLARPFGAFGGEVYAWEELIAELGSAMLAVIVGVPAPDFPNIAAYVESWRQCMQRDTTAVAEAAAAAQKSVDWLLIQAGLPLPS